MKVELFRDYNLFKEFMEAHPRGGADTQVFMGLESPTGSSWWAIVIVY